LSGKGNNLLRCDGQRAKFECVTDVEIFKMKHMFYRVLRWRLAYAESDLHLAYELTQQFIA
jgi:hypothetical protein